MVNLANNPDKIRLLASKKNFESAFLETEVTKDKPYNAITTLKDNTQATMGVAKLLLALVDHTAPIPDGALDAKKLTEEVLLAAA